MNRSIFFWIDSSKWSQSADARILLGMTLPPRAPDEKAHQKKVQQKTQGRYNKDQGKLLFSAVADATVKTKQLVAI